jgi:mono/diheme cytochrome c family protein
MQPETPDNDGSAPPAGRGRGGWRFSVTLIVLFVGMAGLAASAAGVAAQLLPRKFTPAQQQQIANWETARRWRALPAGKIFPATITYQLAASTLNSSSQLPLTAYRVGIARELSCAMASDPAAGRVLSAGHCAALLRATYADETDSMLVTVGVAVMPSAGAARSAAGKLSADQEATVRALGFRGTLAGSFSDRDRQLSWATSDGPYVIMTTAGYANGMPPVSVASDSYTDQEMTSVANGIAGAVGTPLGVQPPTPTCPGAPGC